MKKTIFTVGPSSGKTSAIEELAKRGHQILAEVPERIIKAELTKQEADPNYTGVLPQNNLADFEREVMDQQIIDESRLQGDLFFLDRSLIDIIAYCEVGKISIPNGLMDVIKNADYQDIVFFFDMHNQYEQTAVRHEDEAFAHKIHEKILEVYQRLGFKVVSLPDVVVGFEDLGINEAIRRGIGGRVDFILDFLALNDSQFHSVDLRQEVERKYLLLHKDRKFATPAFYKQFGSIGLIIEEAREEGIPIIQGYLPQDLAKQMCEELRFEPNFPYDEARLRQKQHSRSLGVKAGMGPIRNEDQVEIARAYFDQHWASIEDHPIEKMRLVKPYHGQNIIIDVHTNRGLVMAEVEVTSIGALSGVPPPGLDVTGVSTYYNRNIARTEPNGGI